MIGERGIAAATSPFILLEDSGCHSGGGGDVEKPFSLPIQHTDGEVVGLNPVTSQNIFSKNKLLAWKDDPHAHTNFLISLLSNITHLPSA